MIAQEMIIGFEVIALNLLENRRFKEDLRSVILILYRQRRIVLKMNGDSFGIIQSPWVSNNPILKEKCTLQTDYTTIDLN